MIRKFNYTGRKKIDHSRINISVSNSSGKRSFNASFDSTNLSFPDGAAVYIEPYYKSSFMRFSFGTISNPSAPLKTELTDIPHTDVVLFRLKVVDNSGQLGKILGQADKIHPQESGQGITNSQSLIHVDFNAELDQQIWRVTFDNDFPILEINKNLNDKKEVIKSGIFINLVFPAIVKQITGYLTSEKEFDSEGNLWQNKWMRYIKEVLMISYLPAGEAENDELRAWEDEVVAAFCRKNKVISIFNTVKLT